MKISLNWVSAFTDISGVLNDLGVRNLAHKFSIYTAEIDGIESFGQENKIVIGKVLEVKSHSDSDHLNVVQVDLGKMGKTQIVCGAANVATAKYVPVATIGAKLGEGFEIKATKLRGEESNGMICSEDELGFQEDRAPGIMKLEEIFDEKILESNLGKPFFDLEIELPGFDGKNFKMKLSDIVFEIDNKFITNRPDLFSVIGNAREFGAIFSLNFRDYIKKFSSTQNKLKVSIESDKVLAYNLVKIDNVNASISPFAIRYLLFKSGINSKFDMVDMTNYIMTELGQPMHAFDADKISGNISVRMAKNGEKINALNGEIYELNETDLVIADESKILALAGIMGGIESAVSENTKNIYLESACFDPTSVRLTSLRLALRSDSSTRYEKSFDPLMSEIALSRAVDFLNYLGKDYQIFDYSSYLNKSIIKNIEIGIDKFFIENKLGIEIEKNEIERILKALGFEFSLNGDTYKIKVPSWRATKDISIKEDIVEEIGRINGYDKIEDTPIKGDFTIGAKNKTIELKDKIINHFGSHNFFEVYNYSFSNEILDEKIGIIDHSNSIKIVNAYSNEFTILRRNMVANLLQNVADNIKIGSDFAFFELGKTHQKAGDKFEENLNIAGISYNRDFDFVKSAISGFLDFILPGINYSVNQGTDISEFPYFHPNKSGNFVLENGKKLVTFGYINPIVASNFSLDDSNLIYFEIDFNLLFDNYLASNLEFSEISKFPGIDRELNFVIPEKTPVGEIIEVINNSDILIRNTRVIDIYRNEEKVGENKKSITFSVFIQDFEKTMTDDIALIIQNKIIANLAKTGVELRK
ncbi:phenylalanine--tRNA ligase subunit beta [Candidatus Gracilibacteria bacterium]|nr:phenylalanine--tRNA ligase subunit beta [Candidatus Gracilibacteria bacterium]